MATKKLATHIWRLKFGHDLYFGDSNFATHIWRLNLKATQNWRLPDFGTCATPIWRLSFLATNIWRHTFGDCRDYALIFLFCRASATTYGVTTTTRVCGATSRCWCTTDALWYVTYWAQVRALCAQKVGRHISAFRALLRALVYSVREVHISGALRPVCCNLIVREARLLSALCAR